MKILGVEISIAGGGEEIVRAIMKGVFFFFLFKSIVFVYRYKTCMQPKLWQQKTIKTNN
jgi:hypothetical protein